MLNLSKLHRIGLPLLILALLLVAFTGIFAYRSFASSSLSDAQANRTQKVESTTHALLSTLLDAETGQRGFLLTGRETYLEPYHRALGSLPLLLSTLTAQVATDSNHQARLSRLRPLIDEKVLVLAQSIEFRRAENKEAAFGAVLSDKGKGLMDQIRETVGELATESERESLRLAEVSRTESDTLEIISTSGSVTLLMILGAAVIALRRASALSGEMIEQYRSLTENSPDGIFRVDTETRFQLVNGTCLRITGFSIDDFIGRRIAEVFPGEIGEQWARLAKRVIATGQRVDEECLSKNRVWGVRALPEFGAGGAVQSVLIVAKDISARIAQELALKASEAELRRLNVALITAQEDMARQIARELHDDIAQRLAFLSMELGKAALEPPVDALPQALRLYQDKVKQVSEAIRRISHQMHPSILDDLGLVTALEALCFDLEHGSQLRVHFDSHGVPDDVDKRVASCLYRLGQEALRNIATHSHAHEVTMVLSSDGSNIRLVVVDDGDGFDVAERKPGLGTVSMRERVNVVGGTLTVESAPGKGTRITATTPLRPAVG